MPRAVITGGAGFLGSHLCDRLLAEGYEVLCVDNFITGSKENLKHLDGREGLTLLKHDVSTHLEVDGPVDDVLHFASPASPRDYMEYPIQTLKVGALGTHNTLGLAKAKDARYLLASSSEVYGDPLVNPQPEDYWGNVNPVGMRGCFSADTELLTKEGWKPFPKVTEEDEVLTLVPGGLMEYHKPLEVIRQRYVGELIRFSNTKIDLLVTPNHRMLVRERDRQEFRLVEAYQDITWERAEMLKSGQWEGTEREKFHLPRVANAKIPQPSVIPMDVWLEFFGYFITEGSTHCRTRRSVVRGKAYSNRAYYVLISQSPKHPAHRAKIRDCLKRLGFNFYEEKAQFRIASKQLFSYLRQFDGARGKFIPRDLLLLPPRQLRILLDAMLLGDGSAAGNRFYSSSTALIGDVQEILLKLGMAGSIHRKEEHRPAHAMHILSDTGKDFLTPLYPRRGVEWYDRYVYCVNVPNHIIHVRRNHKALWCGNCYDEGKRYAEALTMAYHRIHGMDTHIARIFNSYGPRLRLNDGRAIPNFLYQALTGRPLTIHGDGTQTRSFCYVSDMVEGLWRLLNATVHEPVNLGNPEERTILELAEKIRDLIGNRVEFVFKDLPQDDPKVRRPDISKAMKELDWKPQVGLDEGLRRTIEYFRGKLGG